MKIKKTALVAILLVLALVGSALAEGEAAKADPKAGESIEWHVIAAGGGQSSSTSYEMQATVGQAGAGSSSSENYNMNHGYMASGSSGCCSIRADINDDGAPEPDIADLVYVVTFMFQEGPPPPCMEAADINGDGSPAPDISDLIHMVTYMFQEGDPPVPC